MPGVSCNLSTWAALRFPSSAMSFNLILLEAAREISDSEKNALIAHSKSIINKLFNIRYPCFISSGRVGFI
ncbi:hypothetical protein XBI1_1570044 [Xenorhabdus bovienii str. Intermedium]|uniref:Uncharacterized protein n=1 Tax=Xenorhabdus bovienii str. Intermedium TaxID=1379677 RepID=A0A077QEW2_XENBV|nr:hypothetical protein XBFFR1_1840049 [Xenorhabdus bovienii str. feltiae France]CDH31570.1 hypothetical protein XBI1_1570044 [Xenorhabdus bovienii str. Intermedium]